MQTACKKKDSAERCNIVVRTGPPLVIVAGFLGAGKTTALRTLIPELIDRGWKPHVVLNDFRNAKIDAELLRDLSVAVEPVSGSCVCCNSRDELLELLAGLELDDRGVVLLEANGTADTSMLVELLTLDRRTQRYSYPVQLTVVDAKRWGKRGFYDFLEKGQVETASFVVVSRRDQVPQERWEKVRNQISQVNSRASLGTSIDFCAWLTKIALRNQPQNEESVFKEDLTEADTSYANSISELSHEHHHHSDQNQYDKAQGGHHHHGHEVHHFASLEVLLPVEVETAKLELWLNTLPDAVLRVKGIARLQGARQGWHVFEMVSGFREVLFHAVKGEPAVSPRAVLIGPELPPISWLV